MGIDKDKSLSKVAAELRRRAEKQLKAKTPEAGSFRIGDETQRLLNELQVHQIELEMQNDELRQARVEVETALENYTDLYDFAPVGYFTLDREGAVRAANLTGATLLGIERARLMGQRFAQFIAAADRPLFTAFLRRVFESLAKDACEVALLKEGKHPPIVHIEAVAAGSGQECRIAVIDITERKWTEDNLRRSEHQLAEAQKLVHLGSWQWDTIVDKITGSDEFYRIFGRLFSSYDEFLELVHPDDRDRVNKAVQDTLDRQSPYNIYYQIVPPNGTILIIHAMGKAIADNAGKVVRMIGTVQDVTERKQLEEKLAASEESARAQAESLRTVLDAAPAVIWIAHDRESRSISGNRAARDLLRIAPGGEMSKTGPSPEKLAHFRVFKDGVELTGHDLPIQRVALSGQPLTDYEYDIVFDDGTVRSLLGNVVPVLDAEGRPGGAVAAVIDITERKRAEAEIQRLASFPLMNPNPILELDANGHMTFCNPAAKRFLENAAYNNDINPLLHQDMPVFLQDLRDKKAGQFSREIEIDGRYFGELIFIAPPFQSVRIYTMDITERKRAEEEIEKLNTDLAARATELEAANIELEAFNYSVSHDLRRPLTTINSYCQVVQELCGSRLDEQCRGYIREMYEGTLRMNQLIDTLLDFSHITRAEMRLEKVDLSKMAEEVALGLKVSEPERRVTFRIAAGITADGDARLLRVVMDNLIGNAWKFTGDREETTIEFGATEVYGKPACFVRDNGPGFDMAHADKLFIPFQRLPGTNVGGHGIGLASVERIIKRHSGRVWAEGAPGKGATFYFTLSGDRNI